MASLFLIVGKNEPLYEAEVHKRGAPGATSDAVARQSYFVVHSSLDLVERRAWETQNVCDLKQERRLRRNQQGLKSLTHSLVACSLLLFVSDVPENSG